MLFSIQSLASLSANGSVTLKIGDAKEVSLFVNVILAPNGAVPTIQYTIQEVDPGDGSTPIGTSVSTPEISQPGVYRITMPVTWGTALLISWNLGSGATFPSIYATLATKTASTSVIYDMNGNSVALANAAAAGCAGGMIIGGVDKSSLARILEVNGDNKAATFDEEVLAELKKISSRLDDIRGLLLEIGS